MSTASRSALRNDARPRQSAAAAARGRMQQRGGGFLAPSPAVPALPTCRTISPLPANTAAAASAQQLRTCIIICAQLLLPQQAAGHGRPPVLHRSCTSAAAGQPSRAEHVALLLPLLSEHGDGMHAAGAAAPPLRVAVLVEQQTGGTTFLWTGCHVVGHDGALEAQQLCSTALHACCRCRLCGAAELLTSLAAAGHPAAALHPPRARCSPPVHQHE